MSRVRYNYFMKKNIEEFLTLLVEDEFVEAHEVLEDLWREWKNTPIKRDESFILKGLINGATALALEKLKREEASKQVWATFLKYEPLIETITSQYTPLYKEAQKLLHVKVANTKIKS